MMNHAYDSYGWYAGQTDSDVNSTPLVPPTCANGQRPAWTGLAWVCAVYSEPQPAAPVYLPMIPFDFLNRLLQPERVAILTLAQTDMNAADFNNLLNRAPSVTLNDPRLVAGVNYCASKIPAITAARVAEILDPSK